MMKLIGTFLCIIIACNNFGYAQNKIYLQDEVKNGKVTEINTDEIRYTDTSVATQVNTVPRDKALLLFNDKGGFLVVAKTGSSSLFLNKNVVDNFIDASGNIVTDTDKIFTINKKVINCKIINEDILSFYIELNGVQLKVDKATVAAVIYKDGSHKLIAATDIAADVLSGFQTTDKIYPSKQQATSTLPALTEKPQPVNEVAKENSMPLPNDTAAAPEKITVMNTEKTQAIAWRPKGQKTSNTI